MSGDRKRASERRLDHLRALRSEHFRERPTADPETPPAPEEPPARQRPVPERSAAPVPPPPTQTPATSPAPNPDPAAAALEVAQVKYEMELADHRQTMARLLAEKDQTIDALRELVTELRTQLDRERSNATTAQPEPPRSDTERPAAGPRHLFDFPSD